MASPFPGMDPYLEDPALWPDVHHGLISAIQEALNRSLRPRYHARVELRVYVSDEGDPGRSVIAPDIRVQARAAGTNAPAGSSEVSATAVVEPIVATTLLDEEIGEARVEIVDNEGRSVVTVIELLNPSNKVIGSKGRQSYLQKRSDVMNSESHWVEINLLRAGARFAVREAMPRCDYLAHVSPRERRPKGLLWPIQMDRRLPVIGIPLRNGDPDAPLDLQEILNTAYERGDYGAAVDYGADPIPPLPETRRGWAREILARFRGPQS